MEEIICDKIKPMKLWRCIMKYRSTRSNETATALEALLKGLADDGGLFVPEVLPTDFVNAKELSSLSYEELAATVLSHYLTDVPKEDLENLCHKAYTGTFSTEEIVPVNKLGDHVSVAEMFHGRTCAFKDLALSLFPYLLVYAKEKLGDKRKILILTATSGDTGKAALEGFKDVDGVNIMVFYPIDGVSPLQKDQMQKQPGSNVKVVGIEGNFDDAQSALKKVFNSELRERCAEKGVLFSSANSINIGRLLPQVVYYVWIWLSLLRNGTIQEGESFNVVVPTGNYGNILAAWLAKKAGVPIGKLISASNENKVLSDFAQEGIYDINREFYVTDSPSMDILISSNFERFLYLMSGSADYVSEKMKELKEKGVYQVDGNLLDKMDSEIFGGWKSSEDAEKEMQNLYEDKHYLMDPHTAVAMATYESFFEEGKAEGHTVIASTAHPYKFPDVVAKSLHLAAHKNPYDTLRDVEKKTGISIPTQLGALEEKEVRFGDFIPKENVAQVIEAYANEMMK